MFPALLIAAFLTSFSPLRAGLEELTILVSADGKQHLILGGDIHDREPGTQTERLAAAIAECQKKDPSTFEVYIEKPFRLFDQTPCLLADAYKELRTRKIQGLKVEDCEIRNVSVLAYWLLGMEYPHGVSDKIVVYTGGKISWTDKGVEYTGGKMCKVGEATVQDLNKEFDDLHAEITQFAITCKEPIKTSFENRLLIAQNQMNGLRKHLARHIITSNLLHDTIVQIANYDLDNPGHYERERIQYAVVCPFAKLFELNLLRKIIEKPTHKRMLLLGHLHTQAIQEFLQEIKWGKSKPALHLSDEEPEQITFEGLASIARLIE